MLQLIRTGLIAFVVVLALWVGGLFQFASNLGEVGGPASLRADGIVVLTGGGERLNVALGLLLDGHAERVLISGVNPEISSEDLRATTIGSAELFECCVDLGKSAENTRGNAIEARDWAALNNYDRIILVTANYHMPRSLREFCRAMPAHDFIPYPVMPYDVHLEDWWKWPGTTRLLVAEYTKYLWSLLISGPAAADCVARAGKA